MSEFETLADLFPPDRKPTRELEQIQKVDRTEQIERDIEEFYETPSATRVLDATGDIVAMGGLAHRFRYVEATFGSGKSHLLKLIGVATGEMDGLEEYAHQLANESTGFKRFRKRLAESHIDHLHPLFMNLLDRDQDETNLPLLLFEELGRRRGYATERTWLLELCWRLEIKHQLWDQLTETTYEGLTFTDITTRPASLRPWLRAAIPELSGADAAGLGTAAAVDEVIEQSKSAVAADEFEPDNLVDRLALTKQHLQRDGAVHEFLIGLDEIAIYVGDQAKRYEEVVATITALIEGINPPIIGTGQWSMRDMQQDFIGAVDEDAWYAQDIELAGADTETIVRKRWLQKSKEGGGYVDAELLAGAPELEPSLTDEADPTIHDDPVEAYPFRDTDLWLLRSTMQGLIGVHETDGDVIQGRALLARVRSLFDKHGWAKREPGVIVSWDVLYDALEADTELIPDWARELMERVQNTLEEPTAVRVSKALFLLSQVESVPRTAENLGRLLMPDVSTDFDRLIAEVDEQLSALADENLIREDIDSNPTTYTILSEEDIRFWQEVQRQAAEIPQHQLRSNIERYLQEADSERLTSDEGVRTRTFGDKKGVTYTVRYTTELSVPDSPSDRYDAVVIRMLAGRPGTIDKERVRWQKLNGGPNGREDILVTVEISPAIQERVNQLLAMQSVIRGMADPRPELRLEQQQEEEDIEDTIVDRLHEGRIYTPGREGDRGQYLDRLDGVVADVVEDKFPERQSVETSLQREDLASLIEFFEGSGDWPLTDADAELFGVKKLPRTIEDGWVTEFTELFSDDNLVDGERILETVEGRRGAFLGTPLEALHALLFVLVAAGRIEVRTDGERVTETAEIARTITTRTGLEDAVIGFDPEPPAEGLDEVYRSLIGEDPQTDETRTLLDGIGDWAAKHASEIRMIATRTSMTFGTDASLDSLVTALEPAFAGDDLNADLLTNPTVIEQAGRYKRVAPLFVSDDTQNPLWDRYKAVYDTVRALHPTATEVTKMQPYAVGTQIPDAETLKSQMEAAESLRNEHLQELYRRLTGEETTVDDRETLCTEVTEALRDDELMAEVEQVSDRYSGRRFDALQSLIEDAKATSGPLGEETLAAGDIETDAGRFENGRVLLETETEDGTASLYERLAELADALEEEHADATTTTQITQAITGTNIPAIEQARRLITRGESLLSDDEDSPTTQTEGERLWENISEREEGTVVVIDTEEQR